MERAELRYNTFFSVIYQIVAVIIGLIIPRLILRTYGSNINGLTYSITQMLSVVTYFDFGVSSVAQAALYKPLVEKDNAKIVQIYNAVRKYFRWLGTALFFYVLVLCIYYAISRADSYSWMFSVSLVLCIAVSMIGQYLFGLTDLVLLSADQKIYIYTIVNIFVVTFNGLATYIGIKLNFSIQVVKLVSSIIFLIRPLFIHGFVVKRYQIKSPKRVESYKLPQQWSGLVQHVTSTLILSLDTIVLTFLSSLQNISIYNVYTLPLNGLRGMITSVGSGYKSFLGHALALDSQELSKEFSKFEILFHFFANLIACVASIMIVPFVMIYTKGVTDTNYTNYVFAYLIVFSYSFLILRIPYTTVIHAAGHFRETQIYCIIEFLINVIVSFSLAYRYGLIGVTIGTLLAIIYRLIASVFYLRKRILMRETSYFIRRLVEDIIVFSLFEILGHAITINADSYLIWAVYAFLYTLLFLVISAFVYVISAKEIVALFFANRKQKRK